MKLFHHIHSNENYIHEDTIYDNDDDNDNKTNDHNDTNILSYNPNLNHNPYQLNKFEYNLLLKTIPVVHTPEMFLNSNKIEIMKQMNCNEKVNMVMCCIYICLQYHMCVYIYTIYLSLYLYIYI